MLKKNRNGIPFFEFELFQQFRGSLRHAVFTRRTNIEDVAEIQKILQTSAPPLSFKNQLHGIKIAVAKNNRAERNGDVLITSKSEIPLFIRIADCASIMIFDPEKKVIANIHAGWRGLAAKIIHKTIDHLCAQFNSQRKNLLAAVSPMIGPCCCRFSDPYNELPSHLHRFIAEENTVNLWTAAEEHLRECGVLPAHIENPRICTSCHPEDFYSYRREGDTGRFGTAIMLC